MLWLWPVKIIYKLRLVLPVVALTLVGPQLTSCSIATAPALVEEGREFPWAKVATIEKGMEAVEVLSIMGQPFTISEDGATLHWRYFQRVRQNDVVRVLGLVPYRKTFAHWEREAEVILRGGHVEAVRSKEVDLLVR